MDNKNERSYDSEEEELLAYELEVASSNKQINADYRKIVRLGISKWLANLQDNKIKLETTEELKRLLEADKLLRDE
ncbi:hypothetical protein [Listeria ilorinensis]|uniref:hypothetical protein n=1 Tax=Listeria ilorinensis TaxID=2867439 RepID=UPI001EF4321A|nr:hypothetical protein [Listeria ilorinensis]